MALTLVGQVYILASVAGILLIMWRYRHNPQQRQVHLVLFGLLILICGIALLAHI